MIDRLVVLLRANPDMLLSEGMRVAGWSESSAATHQSRVGALPEVAEALQDQKTVYRASLGALYPVSELAERKVALAKQNDQLGTALTALDGILEDLGIRECKGQEQFLVLVLSTVREVLVEDVPDRAGNILVRIGERFARRSLADSNQRVLISSKTPTNPANNEDKTGQNPTIGQS
jgi:hypothetical protein